MPPCVTLHTPEVSTVISNTREYKVKQKVIPPPIKTAQTTNYLAAPPLGK
jgi:hypothetical protein